MYTARLHLTYALLFALSAAVFALDRAAAQSLPASLQITRAFALTLESAQLELAPEAQKEVESLKQLRSARTMLVSGIPLILSGVLHAAMFGRRLAGCGPRDRLLLPPVLGAAVAAAGLSLVFAGGFKLRAVSSQHRAGHRPSAVKHFGMAVGALALFAVTQGALFGTSGSALLDCVTH